MGPMSLIGWLKRGHNDEEKRRRHWREAWSAAIEAEAGARLEELRAQLHSLQTNGDDVEMELEMLDALERLSQLREDAARGTLPVVETHHRVISGETCHFSAPASLPDDAAQPSGRVLFTPSRSMFVGGGRTSAIAWHAVQHIVRADRDVLLARADGANGGRFRFNTYADAAMAAFLARRLKMRRVL